MALVIAGAAGWVAFKNNAAPNNMVGNDRDEHGCIGSAGYSWCEVKQKCLRPWEEKCQAESASNGAALSETQARVIAEQSCLKGGESLAPGYYNDSSETWWFDANLNSARPGCSPACVVSSQTKTAEINWRCTGLKEPK